MKRFNKGIYLIAFILIFFAGCQDLRTIDQTEDFSGSLKTKMAGFLPDAPLFYLAWDNQEAPKSDLLGTLSLNMIATLPFWGEAGHTRQMLRLDGWFTDIGNKLGHIFSEMDLERLLSTQGALAFYDVADLKLILLLETNRQSSFFLDILKKELPEVSGWHWQQYGSTMTITNDYDLFKQIGAIRSGTANALKDNPLYRQTMSSLPNKPMLLAFMDYTIIGNNPYFQRYWLGEPLPLDEGFLAYGAILKEDKGLTWQEYHLQREKETKKAAGVDCQDPWQALWQANAKTSLLWQIGRDLKPLPGTTTLPNANWVIQGIYPAKPFWSEVLIYHGQGEIPWQDLVSSWQRGLAAVYGLEDLPLQTSEEGIVSLDLPFGGLAPALAKKGNLLFWSSNFTTLQEILLEWPADLKFPALPEETSLVFWNLNNYQLAQEQLRDIWEVMPWPSQQSRNLALNVMGSNGELLEKFSYGYSISLPVKNGLLVKGRLFY